MPKVSSIKTFNIQSKQNGTCSLDDIIKENIKNSKPLSKIDLSKTNDINLLYDNTIFHDGRYSYDVDEVNYLSDVDETDILMKNEEKDNTIVDNQLYNISLRLSDVSIENIIISNQSIFKASENIEEVKNDNFSNHKKYVPTDKKSGQIHLIKHEDSVIKKENIANKLSINNTIDADYITNLIDFIGLASRGRNKQISVNNLFNSQEMNLTPSYETMPISYKSNIDCNYHSRLILSKRTFNKKIEMPSLENLQKNKCIKNNFINFNENKELKYFFKKWGKTHYVDISINKKSQCYPIFSFNPSDSLVDNRIHSYLNNNSHSEKNLLIIRKDNKDEFNEKSNKYQIFFEDEE